MALGSTEAKKAHLALVGAGRSSEVYRSVFGMDAMKQFLPVFRWMINITLLVAVAASAAYIYLWSNGHQLVQKEILKRFDQAAPELKLIVGATELQGTQGVTLSNVEIRERATDRPLFRTKEVELLIDSTQLVERQQVVVNSIRVKSADVLVARDNSGRWNWQKYKFNRPPNAMVGLPQVLVEDLRIQLTLKHGEGIPTARLLLDCPQLQAVPSSQHAYDIDGSVALPGIGLLKLSGNGDMKSKQWKLGGRLRDVRANQDLMQMAQATAPQIQGQLSKLDTALDQLIPSAPRESQRPAGSALVIGTNVNTAPQFLGMLDVDFDAASSPTGVPDFRLKVGVKDGRLTSPALPVALNNVNAVFYKDNKNLILKLIEAHGDGAQISGNFHSVTGDKPQPGRMSLKIDRFPVTMELLPLLPEKIRRLFHSFQPDALLSGTVELAQQTDGKWRPENLNAKVLDGTIQYHKFRYPTSQIKGTIKQRAFANRAATDKEPAVTNQDVMLDIDIVAKVGDRDVRTIGWMKNPGPQAENFFAMSVTNFAIDSAFRNALEPKQQAILDQLELTGTADANLAFYRPPGLDQVTYPMFDLRVYDAKLKFFKFPYAIDDLSGRITFDGKAKHWNFKHLNGRHGTATVSAMGDFRGNTSPGELNLTINAKNAALNSDLYNALTREQQTIWNMIAPAGFCDLTAVVDWTAEAGQPAIVRFPKERPVRVFNTTIRPKPFPFDMQISEALLSFDPNDARAAGSQKCEIHSFQATHGGSGIRATGWAEVRAGTEWQVHLNDVSADKLQPDNQLRTAMPVSWQATLNRMYQTGTVWIENSEMDFRGVTSGQMNTTAKWNLNMKFEDCAMNAGLDMEHVWGRVTALGEWDGFDLKNIGQINLESAEVLEMPFTNIRGPYSMNNTELVLGSRQIFDPNLVQRVNRDTRVKAQAYGGDLFLDALVGMGKEGKYWFFTELTNARLEQYAARHTDQTNLRGIVNAWMSLEGVGDDPADLTGKGQMVVSQAALYELPVMVKLLSALSQGSFNMQNLTAFNYAQTNFQVANETFYLNLIDMVGESISFRGEGSVGFGGAVNLDFYSRPPRNALSLANLPILNNVLTNWAKVEVRGTTNQPQTIVKPSAKIDDSLKQFLQPFNPNPNAPIPMLNVPRMFQRPTGPVTRQQAGRRRIPLN